MRRSPVWIVPWAIAAVDQLIARRVPALQFYQCIQPTAQVPTSDARPHVANLLLSCTPNFLDVVKLLFDTPAVRDDLQDRFHTHRRVGADVGRPVTAGMFASSVESVGLNWFRKPSELVREGDFDGFVGSETVGLSQSELCLGIHSLHAAVGDLTARPEPVQQQPSMTA